MSGGKAELGAVFFSWWCHGHKCPVWVEMQEDSKERIYLKWKERNHLLVCLLTCFGAMRDDTIPCWCLWGITDGNAQGIMQCWASNPRTPACKACITVHWAITPLIVLERQSILNRKKMEKIKRKVLKRKASKSRQLPHSSRAHKKPNYQLQSPPGSPAAALRSNLCALSMQILKILRLLTPNCRAKKGTVDL